MFQVEHFLIHRALTNESDEERLHCYVEETSIEERDENQLNDW